ncbi:hypothetical protein DQ04_01301010 [Trypanosoma grayi]|uniref:hypothetical protein n=1 Tax=Trypanosoma grayi TaxID=71804 RepID=UPI0004F426EC|nr:hypothetical protein DQ04_01301010 [Trypanosoma grayi]KEG12957.1 hypothetical protein DQ04_01301010 [Trypanosoma grayi]
MTEAKNSSFPSEEMMVRLIEEHLWCGYGDVEAAIRLPLEDENATYLRETVFPTLVPALYELLKREQKRNAQSDAFPGRFGATGNTHAVMWLAQYLLRNNKQKSENLCRHPYVLVNNEVLRKQKEATANEEVLGPSAVCSSSRL